MKKIFYALLFLFIISLILIIGFFRGVIFQEGNPIFVFKSILFIPFSENGFSQFDNGKYITNSTLSDERLEIFMYKKGYTFVEQLGSGYVYENKDGKKVIITGKMFTEKFRVFYVPN